MPIYEFKCSDCQAAFELLVNGETDIECLSCGSKNLTKNVSQVSSVNKSDSCGSGGCSNCSGC